MACLDVVSDMAESPLPFLLNNVDSTARCMAQVWLSRELAHELVGSSPLPPHATRVGFSSFFNAIDWQIMGHSAFEISTRDSAGLVLRNLIEMKPKTIGKKGVVPEVLNCLWEWTR